jgi:hypothetical protein
MKLRLFIAFLPEIIFIFAFGGCGSGARFAGTYSCFLRWPSLLKLSAYQFMVTTLGEAVKPPFGEGMARLPRRFGMAAGAGCSLPPQGRKSHKL